MERAKTRIFAKKRERKGSKIDRQRERERESATQRVFGSSEFVKVWMSESGESIGSVVWSEDEEL